MSIDQTFIAAMIQMRTGLLPGPSLDQGAKLIREAAAQGASFVQTPEVSNMMQVNRTALFEHLQSEEDDRSLRIIWESQISGRPFDFNCSADRHVFQYTLERRITHARRHHQRFFMRTTRNRKPSCISFRIRLCRVE